MGSRITDKKFLPVLASFGSFSKTSIQSHRVSNSPEGREKLDETRGWKKFVRKIRRKISFRPNDPSLSTSRFLLPSVLLPPKGQLFSFHGKNVQLCNNESTRLSFIELLQGWFLRRNLRPIWINIPRQVCCKSRFIASPFVVLGRKLRLIYLLEQLC